MNAPEVTLPISKFLLVISIDGITNSIVIIHFTFVIVPFACCYTRTMFEDVPTNVFEVGVCLPPGNKVCADLMLTATTSISFDHSEQVRME